MVKKFWFLFLVILVEGSALMAVELAGAKLLAPFFGSSLYVWTAILCITVLGLTLGYFAGGRLASAYASEKSLILILGAAAVLVFAMPDTASLLISSTSGIGLIPGIYITAFLLLVPPMFFFGLVGPMVVRLMTIEIETLGNVAGTVYFTSTMGGIAATFLFGFFLIPETGLKFSTLITGIALAMIPAIYIIKSFIIGTRQYKFQLPKSKIQILNSKSQIPKSGIRNRNLIYLFAALEGASVMSVELIAARMLAPYFGSNLYVWVAVIGITLLSLALGYYAGGKLADRYTHIEIVFWVLLTASFFLQFMHYVSQHFTIALMQTDMRIGVVLTSILLVFPPLFFLGMIPTLLIRFLTSEVNDSGETTGKVFTISSASGIIALPIIGFFIIPQFGLTMPSIIIGLLVGVVPFIILLSQKKYIVLLLVVSGIISLSVRSVSSKSTDIRILSYSEGLLGQVLVADMFKNRAGEKINERVLFVNRIGQTLINTTTDSSEWNYINLALSVAGVLPEKSKALVLGLGGGSAANELHKLSFGVEAVELDKRIALVAKDYFDLNPEVNVIVDDARHYLEVTTQRYDLILFDVFRGDIQPPHVLSVECFEKARSLLSADGLMIVNFNGFLNGDKGKPGRSVYATLVAAGLYPLLLPTPGREESRNTLFIAAPDQEGMQKLKNHILNRVVPDWKDLVLINPHSLAMHDAHVFRDDKPNLDRLNLEASDYWRRGYNAYYANFFLENGVPLFN